MMIEKYKKHWHDMYAYINNRIQAGIDPETVAGEVYDRYRAEVLFHDVGADMINVFCHAIVSQAYYDVYGEHYEIRT